MTLLLSLDTLREAASGEVFAFFRSKLSLIDFLVIGLGTFVLVYQTWVRLGSTSGQFLKRAGKDPLFLEKTALKLRYTSTLIEILPLMGILGTVWGLMKALFMLQHLADPTIGDIAIHIAPALTTTFTGLSFAVINLFLYNYLETYLNELSAWYETYHGAGPPLVESGAEA